MTIHPDVDLAVDVICKHLTMFDVIHAERLKDLRMKLTIGGDTKRIYEKRLGGKVDKFIVILSNEEINTWFDPVLGIYISMSTVDLPGALTLINLDHCKRYIKNRVLADYDQVIMLEDIHIGEVNDRATVFISSRAIVGYGNVNSRLTHAFRDELNQIHRHMRLAIIRERQLKCGDLKCQTAVKDRC